MAFNSLHFLVFFPTVLVLYHALPQRFRWVLLLAASLYFYMAWRAIYVLLLLAAIVVSYVVGIKVEDVQEPAQKRRYLALGLVVLLGNLFVFKYFNFFNDSVRGLVEAVGLHYGLGALKLALPIGISFYTFQKASYLIDIYRGKQKAERHLGIFALYSSFFPQLVAGPIERGPNLLPQFREEHRFDYDQVASGFRLMAWGFFKKCVVADRLAPFVNDVYASPAQHAGTSLILATLLFAFQVYCDFSGYSDIAIGCARTIGFRLMDNFRQPYFSTSIQEFWKRWHISLSSWLTDYVYTPFTRAKWLKLHWYTKLLLSLLLTFLVSGLWHGANWTFVAWGALHGSYLIAALLLQKKRARAVKALGLDRYPRLLKVINIAFTFTLVCVSYIFFRANTLADGFYVLWHGLLAVPQLSPSSISDLDHHAHSEFALACLGVAVVMLTDYVALTDSKRFEGWWQKAWVRRGLDFAVAAGIVLFGAFYGGKQTFIYFEF